MPRKTIFILLIILGCALLFASITFWLDTLTSTEPVGLGQQIRDWLTVFIDLLTWISAYLIKRSDTLKSTSIKVTGGNPQILTGDNARSIQINHGNYYENIEINITPPSEEEKEKNKRKYELRNKHEFEAPRYLYRPIHDTIEELQEKLEKIQGGYLGVFGPPGSGKSTFLTQTLRKLPARLIRYYAYVPDAQDPSILRGESINFFHDITLTIQQLGVGEKEQPDTTDRIALIELFNQQLSLLGKDYEATKTRTIILVDGLDHIEREQHPERSLLTDLPSPNTIPNGVYIIVGSQTKEFPNLLPVSIEHAFLHSERTILMGKLTPQNVFEIVHQTLPEIDNSFDERIYQIVDGHPLSLIYLLNALAQSESSDNYETILEKIVPYQGNIDEQYFSHWKKIEGDQEFGNFLGLLARIRGPIPMNWVAQWAEETLLKKMRGVFGQYFTSDSLGRWEFFHNSFRIFLEAKTAERLPGLASEQINQKYHLKLAQFYEKSDDPYKWETLYHYYKASEHKRVVDIAQYDWFRSQVEALRPIDAVETDVRLAIKSAGELLDTVALVRYTLIGASLQQRSSVLENSQLPNLLIEAGRSDLAIDYSRDGARLRLEDKMALSLSRNLIKLNQQEAVRIFELAEPLEYLSGRLISEKHTQRQDLHDLLSEWVESASLLRLPIETAQIIRRIQIEPSWNDENKDVLQASLDLQNWLLYIGSLNCCEREDWEGWKIYFEALDAKRDKQRRYFTLLHTIAHLRQNKMNDRARQLLLELLEMDEPSSFGSGRNKTANLLSVVEAVYFLEIDNYQTLAKFWFEKIDKVPLSDKELSYSDNSPKLINLHFRYARMNFALDANITPDQLIKEVEKQTTFEEFDDNETRLARRQIALIAITLAKLWIEGYTKNIKEPDAFLSKTKWIFDLMESGWQGSSATFRLQTEGVKEDISEYLVACAVRHGEAALQAIKNEFSLHWKNGSRVWWAGIQREITLAVAKYDTDYEWAKNQLELIETFMLRGLDVYGRVKECEAQASAWLQLGEKTQAVSMLYQLVKCARGVYSEKDYQLSRWANWLRKTNLLSDNTRSSARIEKFIRQVFSVEDTASGVDDALIIVLQAVFDVSPHKSIQLYKKLLEQKAITYDEGLINLLLSALESQKPPLTEVYWVMGELLFPFTRSTSSELITSFIAKTNLIQGKEKALQLSQSLAEKITTDVQENHRADWINGIHEGLTRIGINTEISEIPHVLSQNTNSSSSLDYKLHLLTGESLNLQDAILMTSTIDDFRSLLEKEKRQSSNYFEWYKLAISLIEKIVEIENIQDVCSLIEGHSDSYSQHYLVRVYTKASQRSYQLGNLNYSKQTIQKALSLTNPSGWSAYYDGGAKYDAMLQAIKLFGPDFRNELAKLYVQDLSERHRYSEELARNLDEIIKVLFEEIPYKSIWPDIENYLEELFGGIVVEAQPELEVILETSVEIVIDDASNALAELLMLYLDFPAFPVFDGAIKTCAKLLLADNSAVKNALKLALKKHDQLVRQGLIALEIVSLRKPSASSFFQDELAELSTSPNMILRMIATKILINSSGQSLFPPKLNRSLPAIYSLHLPDIALHKTEYSLEKDSEPILLRDPALLLQPMDIDARKIAQKADVPESNLLYHAAEKLKDIEVQRTWLFNGLALEPRELMLFLEKINLRISHNKPKIFPCKNSVAHIAAELYDAERLSFSDLAFLEAIFRDYDPSLFVIEAESRPGHIEGMGGFSRDLGSYLRLSEDWEQTLETSLPLLKSRSFDGRIVLGEWTHLKRLQDNWPTEERISLLRAVGPYAIWNETDLEKDKDKLPFANAIELNISDYLRYIDCPERELVVAHNGFIYQMEKANWLGLNPRVGFGLGWQPVEGNLFSWKNKDNQLVVESVYWQDGNFDSNSRHDNVEVGYGWLVLITEDGYQEMRRRYGVISRGGVIKRSLGQFGINRKTVSSILDAV